MENAFRGGELTDQERQLIALSEAHFRAIIYPTEAERIEAAWLQNQPETEPEK